MDNPGRIGGLWSLTFGTGGKGATRNPPLHGRHRRLPAQAVRRPAGHAAHPRHLTPSLPLPRAPPSVRRRGGTFSGPRAGTCSRAAARPFSILPPEEAPQEPPEGLRAQEAGRTDREQEVVAAGEAPALPDRGDEFGVRR